MNTKEAFHCADSLLRYLGEESNQNSDYGKRGFRYHENAESDLWQLPNAAVGAAWKCRELWWRYSEKWHEKRILHMMQYRPKTIKARIIETVNAPIPELEAMRQRVKR